MMVTLKLEKHEFGLLMRLTIAGMRRDGLVGDKIARALEKKLLDAYQELFAEKVV